MKLVLSTPKPLAVRIYNKAFRMIVNNNYHLAKMFYIRNLEKQFSSHRGSPILIYQMGKVGSSSIKRSLKELELDIPLYHVHFLTDDRIDSIEKDRRRYFNTENLKLLHRPWLYQFLKRHIEKGLKGRKWRVISLVRDPVVRNISAFFENLNITKIDSHPRYRISSDILDIDPLNIALEDVQLLFDLFFDKFQHNEPLNFFDQEIKTVFGIDVFESTFPHASGYQIYRKTNADLLLLRLEDLNQQVEKAFGEFLGVENIALVNKNIGQEKEYARLYKRFKKFVQIPDAYLKKMYDSQFMQHFYSHDEIHQFKLKWGKRS